MNSMSLNRCIQPANQPCQNRLRFEMIHAVVNEQMLAVAPAEKCLGQVPEYFLRLVEVVWQVDNHRVTAFRQMIHQHGCAVRRFPVVFRTNRIAAESAPCYGAINIEIPLISAVSVRRARTGRVDNRPSSALQIRARCDVPSEDCV